MSFESQPQEPTLTKRRLWLVSEVYYPEEISTGYYLTTIAEGLTDDHDVKVLTGQPKHMARGVVAPKHEIRNGVEIFRTWGTTLDKNVMLFRLINMATIGIGIFFSSLKRFRKGDHILVVTAPPSLPVTTTLAVLLKGASFTLLVQDSYPEILEACGNIKKGGLASNVINFFNRWVYKYASRIIVMGRDMKELFEKKASGLSVPVIPIPNWADLESVSPMPRAENKLLAELGIIDKFVLLYAGNIGHPTDVETIICAAEKLQHRKDFYFVFIGSGAKKPWVENEVERLLLKNVCVLDYRPREEQRDFLNGCDVGLVALIDGMWGTAMPSRTYNIMAAGKPVLAITEQASELARVIDEDLIGTYVPPGDVDGFIRSLEDLYSDRNELEAKGRRARDAAVAKYSASTAVESYRRALNGLSDGQ